MKKWNVIKMFSAMFSLLLVVNLCSGCACQKDIEDWDYVLTLGIDCQQTEKEKIKETKTQEETKQQGKIEAKMNLEIFNFSFGIATKKSAKVKSQTADTITNSIKKYESTHDKSLQIGHIVAVILGKDVYQNRNKREVILEQLQKQTQIPVATSIYIAETNARSVMEQCPQKKKTMGEYLEDTIGNNHPDWKKQVAIRNLFQNPDAAVVLVNCKQEDKKEHMITRLKQVILE